MSAAYRLQRLLEVRTRAREEAERALAQAAGALAREREVLSQLEGRVARLTAERRERAAACVDRREAVHEAGGRDRVDPPSCLAEPLLVDRATGLDELVRVELGPPVRRVLDLVPRLRVHTVDRRAAPVVCVRPHRRAADVEREWTRQAR